MLSSPVVPTVVSNPVYREDGPIDLASRHRNVLPENVTWSTTSAKPQIQVPTYFNYGYYPLQERTVYPIPNIPLGYDYSVKEALKRPAPLNDSEQKVKRRPPDLNIKKVDANDFPVKPIWRPVSPTVISKGEPPQLSDKPHVSSCQSVGVATHSTVPKQANPLRGARGQPLAPFRRGSLVRLANNSLKRVEELNAEDFVLSAQQSPDIQIEKSVIQCLNENVDGSLTITFLTGGATKVGPSKFL
ncbi:hypothetical protein QYM36_001932 [Artemia franciscana]|uniref:AXH domain-containing protein n=1 Tax=Artemia franciscana TaxID=6661 RepID=A0AA88I603_ARTSF|nr:hypothetical protein QYM36_001932 [Artemia franciscana]